MEPGAPLAVSSCQSTLLLNHENTLLIVFVYEQPQTEHSIISAPATTFQLLTVISSSRVVSHGSEAWQEASECSFFFHKHRIKALFNPGPSKVFWENQHLERFLNTWIHILSQILCNIYIYILKKHWEALSEFGTLKLGGGGGDGVIFSVLLFISLQRYVMKSRVILTEYFTVHVQKKKKKTKCFTWVGCWETEAFKCKRVPSLLNYWKSFQSSTDTHTCAILLVRF